MPVNIGAKVEEAVYIAARGFDRSRGLRGKLLRAARFSLALASPCSAALVYHFTASVLSFGTPWPIGVHQRRG